MHEKNVYLCNKTIGSFEKSVKKKWKYLNPDYKIKLYDNEMCREFLVKHYGDLFGEIFDYLEDGPIKADLWRICILHKKGGVYSDIDIVPLQPLCNWIESDVQLVTCSSYWDKFKFNPNFIVSEKNNVSLEKCIDWYVNKYNNRHTDKYNYWDFSIMNCFTQTLHLKKYCKKGGVYHVKKNRNMKVQIIRECKGDYHYDAHNKYKNVRVFNNRSELWDSDTHSVRI